MEKELLEQEKAVVSSDVAAQVIRAALHTWEQENFIAILLNARNVVIDTVLISLGTLTETLVHPRDVFREAIRQNARAVVVGHNHPSGNVHPSREDKELTARLAEAGKILGVPVLDHVIVTPDTYCSLLEG